MRVCCLSGQWIAVAQLALCGCSLFDGIVSCTTEVQKQDTSPGGRYVATVFHRECGATSGFNTQVSIRRSSQSFDPKQGQVLAIDGRHALAVKWTSDEQLLVDLPPDRIYNEQTRWETVRIEYRRPVAMPEK